VGLRQTTPPATLPVSLTEAKEWLRVDGSAQDDQIEALIGTALRLIERQYDRQLVTATWQLTLDAFPDWEIRAPRNPLRTVTAITYVDTAGDTQTLSASRYTVDPYSDPGRIVPAYGYVWPATRSETNAVTISFTAGYGSAAEVPETIKQAIRLCVASWFDLRGDAAPTTLPPAVEQLCLSEWGGEYC